MIQDQSEHLNDVAVIGMSGSFPGAANVDAFWANLRAGVESITFFPDQELQAAGVPPNTLKNPRYVKAAPRLDGIDLFDPAFFGFTLGEAEFMDPQARLLLKCAWETVENGGYDPERYTGAIGVFAGCAGSTYLTENLMSRPELQRSRETSLSSLAIWNERDSLSTLISYKLNLTGPSFSVQSFCSTSLVAIHLACQSLLSGESDMALAGGANIRVPQTAGYLYEEGMILSPDGHCRSFDARAEGTIFGNGLGLILLKRLSDAIADGDCIHAIIKGSAVNNDGSQKAGYTAPSVVRQAKVITEAMAVAGVKADSIAFLEAHGTGTAIGDPIEIEALSRAFQQSTDKKQFCPVGSVKSNIGHLDRAAGVASLIKAILVLKHHEIPPSLHYEKPNPKIDFGNSPFYVNTELSQWKSNGTPMRAGVTSLGFGGTNAHVVLEEPPRVSPSGPGRDHKLLLLSARTPEALEAATKNLAAHLREHPDTNLADVAYTLQVGRAVFNHSRMLVCQDANDAVAAFESKDPTRIPTQSLQHRDPPVVFMFPGQGAQYVNMGAELYRTEPAFKFEIDRCTELLRPSLEIDLRRVMYPADDDVQKAEEELTQTPMAQPALFVTEYALAKLWMSWGVTPSAMIGHSVGEYVAGCLAGVFTLEEALTLVAGRARMVQRQPSGAMLAVRLPESELVSMLDHRLSIAAVNSPSLSVVAGPLDATEALEKQLELKGVLTRRLHASHAFHSSMMDPVIGPFRELVGKVNLKEPRIPFVSNVSGQWVTPAEATSPSYWAGHVRQTVRFADGVAELSKDPKRILLEVGPGQTLATLARQYLVAKRSSQMALASVDASSNSLSENRSMLMALGKLCLSGISVNWEGFYANEKRRRVPLPTYPFEMQRCWIESKREELARESLTFAPSQFSEAQEQSAGSFLTAGRASERQQKEQLDESELPNGKTDIHRLLLSVEPGRARRALLETQLQQQVAHVLRSKPTDIDLNQPLKSLGVDSLMTLEIRRGLELFFGLQLPATLIYNYPTIAALTPYIAQQLKIELEEPKEAVGQRAVPEDEALRMSEILAEIELLSDEEVLRRTTGKAQGT